ncbi:hypothetical protein HHI36_019717 [Cryptolaemus montrouzieri]|uniref:LRAT domain-containing protein n=1 Tax=Cryptolaemus montrouzieri TaxID=559131 RepID=A0ABD2N9A1_9CUCU
MVAEIVTVFSQFILISSVLQLVISSPVNEHFDEMKWEAGDIISCNLNGVWGIFAKHFMLAVDGSNVINVAGDKSTNKGTILEQTRRQALGFNRSKCRNNGKGKLSVEQAIKRARRWQNTDVYYNLLRCNCEHWVDYWANGSSGGYFDNQSLLPTNSQCTI